MVVERWSLLTLLFVADGCATASPSGSMRRNVELATIEPSQTRIVKIDGESVTGGAGQHQLLAGEHAIEVALGGGDFMRMQLSNTTLAVCFRAREGRAYRIVAVSGGNGLWW